MNGTKAFVIRLVSAACLATAGAVAAEPTEIEVRVISRGAKFIGTSMGGVRVILRDAETGELLAEGITKGGTGDTERIMEQAHRRGAGLATEDAAVFSATLQLQRPRYLQVTASGPLAQAQSMNTVSATQWVVPGRHLSGGDGWVLEMPGFVVDVLAPPAHLRLKGNADVEIRANVTFMCGCPIEPDGLWDADRYEVAALISRNGEPAGETALAYAGSPSQFQGVIRADAPGTYEVTVFAYDPESGNTGLDRVTFIVD